MTETKERAARPNKGERKMVPIRFPLDVLERLDSRALTDGLARNDAIVEAVAQWAGTQRRVVLDGVEIKVGAVTPPTPLPGAPGGNTIIPRKPSAAPKPAAEPQPKPSVAARIGETPDPGRPAYGSRLKGAPVKKVRAKKPA